MTLYFTIPDVRPDWFEPVCHCAEVRSGLPVRVVDQMSDHLKVFGDQLLAARNTPEEGEGMRRFCALGLLRWPMLLEAVRDLPPSDWPICCLDWDILVCEDMRPWLAKFARFDYAITRDKNGLSAGPYLLRDIRPLRTFCSALCAAVENASPAAAWTNDMHAWDKVNSFHNWAVGDMGAITDRQVFDHNLGEESGAHFAMDGDHKKVLFENGHAYFFTQSGTKIETVALHCWSTFKEQIPAFVKQLGV
jgi:hypothetical protein